MRLFLRPATYLVLIFSILILSCVKDKPSGIGANFTKLAGKNLLIVNEGNFGTGNASIEVYNLSQDSLQRNVYEAINGESIGDVLQEVIAYEDRLYLVVNNSNKIIVVDRQTLKKESVIDIPHPRKMLPLRQDKIYISSLYNSNVWVYNPILKRVVDTIALAYENVEDMVLYDGKVMVSPWDTECSKVFVINPNIDKVIDSIDIQGAAPKNLLVHGEDLWVFYGNVWKDKLSGITVYDMSDAKIKLHKEYEGKTELVKPILSIDKTKLFWLGIDYGIDITARNGVMSMGIDDITFPDEAIIKADGLNYFYGLTQLQDGMMVVCNPNSFLSGSTVFFFDRDYKIIRQIYTGIGTNSILLWE